MIFGKKQRPVDPEKAPHSSSGDEDGIERIDTRTSANGTGATGEKVIQIQRATSHTSHASHTSFTSQSTLRSGGIGADTGVHRSTSLSRTISPPPFVSPFGGVAPEGADADEGLVAVRSREEEEERIAQREEKGIDPWSVKFEPGEKINPKVGTHCVTRIVLICQLGPRFEACTGPSDAAVVT